MSSKIYRYVILHLYCTKAKFIFQNITCAGQIVYFVCVCIYNVYIVLKQIIY